MPVGAQVDARRSQAAERTVEAFFSAFCRGHFEAARAHTEIGFEWFGRPVSPNDWRGEPLARFLRESPLSATNIRTMPRGSLEALPQDDLRRSLGRLSEWDQMVLIDVTRGEATWTAAAIVSCRNAKEPSIRRVIDPAGFVNLLASAQGDPS